MSTPAPPLVLVTLDGSGTAEYILPWAAAIAVALPARLLLLQLIPGGSDSTVQSATHYLDGVASDMRGKGIQVETRAAACDKEVGTAIANAAEETHAALTLIATRGRTGVSRMILGSVADEVVHAIRGAVLVLKAGTGKPGTAPPSVKRVLLTLDASPQAETAIPYAVRAAQAFGAMLNVVQAAPLASAMLAGTPGVVLPDNLDQEIEEAAATYLRGVKEKLPAALTTELHVLRGPAAGEILDHAENTHADLIVMSTRGRSGVARWTLGSVADKVLRGGTVPVMLVRAREDPA